MKFLTFTILALVALSRTEGVQEKRGVAAQQTYAAQPAALAYAKVQQPVQKVVAAPQSQYYTQQAAAPAYSFPVQQQFQYQPQQQAVAYAQPTFAKYAAAPAPEQAVAKLAPAVYRQPFSQANDVSSFSYSSPLVTYNSLGLLTQVIGKGVGQQAKAAAAPAPVAYQSPVQQPQAAYAKYALQAAQPAQRVQQYLAQAPQQAYQAQAQTYQAAPQLQAYQAQTYQAAPQSQAYQGAAQAQAYQAAAQGYTAQSAPQSIYAQAPQYYSAPQPVKQVSAGVAYA